MIKRILSTMAILLAVALLAAGCTSGAATTTAATTTTTTTPATTTTTTPAPTTTPTTPATPDNEIQVSLGQEFTLPVNQTAVLKGENIAFKFESVTGDSRCPTGAQCVWAGEAKCQMLVTPSGQTPAALVLTEGGGTAGYSQSTYQSYKIAFQVQPYPEVGKTIAPGDYKLRMIITK